MALGPPSNFPLFFLLATFHACRAETVTVRLRGNRVHAKIFSMRHLTIVLTINFKFKVNYSLFVKQLVNIVEGPKLINIIHEVVYDVCSRHLSRLLVTTPYTSQCLKWMYLVLLIMNIGARA